MFKIVSCDRDHEKLDIVFTEFIDLVEERKICYIILQVAWTSNGNKEIISSFKIKSPTGKMNWGLLLIRSEMWERHMWGFDLLPFWLASQSPVGNYMFPCGVLRGKCLWVSHLLMFTLSHFRVWGFSQRYKTRGDLGWNSAGWNGSFQVQTWDKIFNFSLCFPLPVKWRKYQSWRLVQRHPGTSENPRTKQ